MNINSYPNEEPCEVSHEEPQKQNVIKYPTVFQTSQFRQELDDIFQRLKIVTGVKEDKHVRIIRSSRERSLAITKVQEAIMCLDMDLEAMREEGMDDCEPVS